MTGDRTEFIGRNGTLAVRPRWTRVAVGSRRRRARSVRRRSDHARPQPREERTISGCSATPTMPRPREHGPALSLESGERTGARRLASLLGQPAWRRCRSGRRILDGPDDESLAACTRRSPAASGDARPSTSRAAPTGSAISCRTCWRCCVARRTWPREHVLRCGVAAVRGRRRAALVARTRRRRASARGSPTICSGCRLRSLHTSSATGDDGVLDEQVPFLEGPPLEPGRTRSLRTARRLERTGTLYEHCVRAIARQHARPARTACR